MCPPGSSTEPFKPQGTCILLVTDVAGYGSLRTRSAQEELRAQHYRMLEDCLSDAEIRPETCYWEDRGDGVIVAIPAHHGALEDYAKPLRPRGPSVRHRRSQTCLIILTGSFA
jgi:hypothetical protein